MGGAIAEVRQARRGAADLHVELSDGDGLADLVKGPSAGKYCKGVGKGDLAGLGKARRHRGHISLCNPHLKVALGIGGLEIFSHSGSAQIGIQDHQVLIFFSELYKRTAVSLSLICISHITSSFPQASSDRAC